MPARRLPVLLVLCLLTAGCGSSTQQTAAARPPADTSRAPTVILVSLDGFRWDYPEKYATPNLDRIAGRGLRAEALIPVFPTKTFPNHYTQVTGLYPERHGIVGNTMYDPQTGASFSLSDREAVADARWWGGEPLWVTTEKQGQTAATYFWPGSEAPIAGVRPTYWRSYDGRVPAERRVDQVLEWLDLPPEERPTFVTLYFSLVDTEGHRHGPDAPETAAAARRADAYLGRLLYGLEARGILDETHLIVTSDHGMAATSPERVVFLDDYVDTDALEVLTYSPLFLARPKPGRTDGVFAALEKVPHLRAYRKRDVPARLHFSDHRRIPPLVGLMDEGWSLTTRGHFERNRGRYAGGAHGYDNRYPSMRGIFYAQGPAFRAGQVAAPFSSVHLYALMAEILGLRPAPNDGDPAVVRRLLDGTYRRAAPLAR